MSTLNLYLSLLLRVRKQAKLQLLSVSWESGFCWTCCTRGRGGQVDNAPPPPSLWKQWSNYHSVWDGIESYIKDYLSGFIRHDKNIGLLRPFQLCSWQHEDGRLCSIVYCEGGFLTVEDSRSHQDVTAGALTEGNSLFPYLEACIVAVSHWGSGQVLLLCKKKDLSTNVWRVSTSMLLS